MSQLAYANTFPRRRRPLFSRPIEQRPVIISLCSDNDGDDDDSTDDTISNNGTNKRNTTATSFTYKAHEDREVLLERKQREIMAMREKIAQLERAQLEMNLAAQNKTTDNVMLMEVNTLTSTETYAEMTTTSNVSNQYDITSTYTNGRSTTITANNSNNNSNNNNSNNSVDSKTPDKEVTGLNAYLKELEKKLAAMRKDRGILQERFDSSVALVEEYRSYLLMAEHEQRTIKNQLDQQWTLETELCKRIEVEQARLEVLKTRGRRKLNNNEVNGKLPDPPKQLPKTSTEIKVNELEEGEVLLEGSEKEEGECLPEPVDWEPVYQQLECSSMATSEAQAQVKSPKPPSVASSASSMDISTGSEPDNDACLDGVIDDTTDVLNTTSVVDDHANVATQDAMAVDPIATSVEQLSTDSSNLAPTSTTNMNETQQQRYDALHHALNESERSLREAREGIELLKRAGMAKNDMKLSSMNSDEPSSTASQTVEENTATLSQLVKALTTPLLQADMMPIPDDTGMIPPETFKSTVTPFVVVGGTLRVADHSLTCVLPSSFASTEEKHSSDWLNPLAEEKGKEGKEEDTAPTSDDTSAAILKEAKMNPSLSFQTKTKFTAYESILPHFRSTRLMSSSAASAVPSSSSAGQATTTQISLHGLTMSPKIRPFAKWCLFEAAGGICRDNSCFSMHLRDISFDDRELLADLCSYTRGETLEEQVNYTRQIVDILRSDQDVKMITQKLLEFQANCQLDVSQSIVFNKRNTRVRHLLSTVLSKKNADKQAADKRAKQPVKSDVKVVLANSSPILPMLPPIQLAMLQNAMTNQNSNKSNKQDGKDGSTSNRYYSQEQYTTEQYESMVTQHPDRIDLWIAYAQHLLPSPLTMDILRAPGTQLDDTLRILSRALSVCPASEALWNMYLEFMMRRGDIGAVQNLIEHALRYTSMAWCIRWRHYLWEEGSNKKHAILGDMTKDVFDSNQLDVQQRSQRLLDVLVQLVSLVLKEKGADTAIYTLFRLIACTERADFISLMINDIDISESIALESTKITSHQVLAQLLQPVHLTVLITTYCHLLLWHSLPSNYLLYAAPNDFVTIGGLVLLRYDQLNELPMSEISDSPLLTSVYAIWINVMQHLLSIKDADEQVAAGAMSLEPLIWSFKAAAQNCHHLAKTFSLPRNDLHDILVTSLNQWPNATLIELYIEIESNKERGINYLSNTIQQQLQQQSEIEHINLNFLYYHWIVEYLSSALMQEDKAQVRNVLFNQLCNCIKRYFDKNKMHAYTTPQHIEPLYRKLLGLPASVHTPPVLKNISLDNTRTDIYLWLNYLFLLQLINTRAFNDGLSMDDAFSQMFTAIISKSNTITSIYPWEGTLYALWRTFITWTTEHKSGNSLLKRDKEDRTHFIYSSLEQAISQLVINHEHRYNPGDVIPMAKLIPLKDWTLINGLLEQCMDLLPVLSRAKKSHLFYLLIENVYYWRMFIYSLAVAAELKEGYPLQRQFVKIEQSFINALSKFPHDQALWTMRLTFVKQLTSAVSNDSKDKDNGDDKGDDDDDDKTTEKNALLSSVINEAKRYLPMHTTTNLHCS